MSSRLSSNMARMTGITLGAFRKCYENGKCYDENMQTRFYDGGQQAKLQAHV